MRIGLRDDEMMIKIVIADLIVDLLAEMIEMIVDRHVEMIGMIAEAVEVGDRLHGMIVVAIVMLIIGVPDLELCLHPRTIAVIVHLGMDHLEMIYHPNDPKVIKNLKMTDGVKLLNVN